ncbi:protein mono-ADP-ribosyltransferase PARP10 isoform X2 [Larus michahellis]|uniref:protein mono-ADP-ribosyltransferase PARP10 isoform X2 n=1 Tax=Larus michahellis TaxID=119627 RepID=UPI003D9AD323
MAGAVLEVGGVPPDAPEELPVLYFESRRRSGGGPVESCQRLGPLLFLTFHSPQDAENVLAQGTHRLGGWELRVRPAPPWHPTRLLLGGLDPCAPPEELEPPLGSLLGRAPGTFGLSRGPAPGWALLRLRDPMAPLEFAAAAERVQQRGLAGSAVSLLRLPVASSVVVRAEAPVLSRDLLELYFENRRSGGGSVRDVRVLPGGRAAVVTFQEAEAAERVLQRPHRLQDAALALAPHYPFLGTLEGDETPPPDTATAPGETPPTGETPPPATATAQDTAPAPPAALAPSPDTAPPPGVPPPSDVSPPPAPTGPVPAEPPVSSPVPVEPPSAFPGGDGDTAVAGRWQRHEALAAARDEVVVPAEPGALRYLHRHYQDLLASIPEVSLLPLEGGDVSGFRVSGEPGRCRAAAEFLQSLLGTVGSQPVTLRFPGVARFLRDEGGQSVIRQLESRFQCVIDLDGVRWDPPDPQTELAELLAAAAPQPDLPEDEDGADGDGLHHSIEEIKELLAALRPGDAAGDAEPPLLPGHDLDPFTEPPDGGGAGEPPWGGRRAGMEEEEEEEAAQMVLAIQRSMEDTGREEEELARATALSLRSHRREEEEEEEDAGLLAALEASLEEWLPAADAARVLVFSSFERDVAAVPGELERALAGRLRAQTVQSERLQALPARCRQCLVLLQRRHAVHLGLHADTATLHGFAEYTAAAARDLHLLLRRLPQPGRPRHGTAGAHWVRWDHAGTAVPYPGEAAALLEGAWQRRQRRLDLLLDGRPFTVDLQRMEEYDIGNASVAPVSRSQPPADSLLGPAVAAAEEEVRLLRLAEDSEEFRDTVSHFYQTLEELHSQIAVVKYRLKRASMERGRAGGAPVERVLFHGTSQSSSREICLHGFNRSFCGKNAALYGLGVYFAARAAISAQDRYSPPAADGTKRVFVAKVLTGEFAAGGRGLRAPPLRDGAGPPRRYDSVVDDPRRPAIFVIFNDTQAYPQYLLTCRRRGGPR